ncbi:MAG: hypothetical protein ABTQ31_06365 [Rhizobiaceae bacterium]
MEALTEDEAALIENGLHAVRNGVQELLLGGAIQQEQAVVAVRGAERCVDRWRREGRTPAWIANQLGAVAADMACRQEKAAASGH